MAYLWFGVLYFIPPIAHIGLITYAVWCRLKAFLLLIRKSMFCMLLMRKHSCVISAKLPYVFGKGKEDSNSSHYFLSANIHVKMSKDVSALLICLHNLDCFRYHWCYRRPKQPYHNRPSIIWDLPLALYSMRIGFLMVYILLTCRSSTIDGNAHQQITGAKNWRVPWQGYR